MTTTLEPPTSRPAPAPQRFRRRTRRATSLIAHGEPYVWLAGGSLAMALAMIAGLLILVAWFGGTTFWPESVARYELSDGSVSLGAVRRAEEFTTEGESRERTLVRVGNRDLYGVPFRWLDSADVSAVTHPEWALTVERRSWGRAYGFPAAFRIDGEVVTEDPADVWGHYLESHGEATERFDEVRSIEEHEVGRVNRRLEAERLRVRAVRLEHGEGSPEAEAAEERYLEVERESTRTFEQLGERIAELRAENARHELVLETAEGTRMTLEVAGVVRAFPPNQLGLLDKVGVYFSRWREFLLDDPRDANMEGGVFPAIVGTVAMTLVMTILVVPFGVLAALYLREYAKQGLIVSIIRIAVNNLAGVPSIVFGVFGLGFFCYIVGGSIDQLFYPEALPDSTFGKRGLVWASLTLALLTLPVVIVATEEALAAVPGSMREGSYACGATKWQTIRRIVLPRAAPGIMTGMILAIARGAGEVAPLMLVGAVKLAPSLPVDMTAPFVHPSRSFMHLGFHIYDLGFQSPDSEAAKPMIYTTTLLLIAIVVILNSAAFWVRGRLRKRFQGVHI